MVERTDFAAVVGRQVRADPPTRVFRVCDDRAQSVWVGPPERDGFTPRPAAPRPADA